MPKTTTKTTKKTAKKSAVSKAGEKFLINLEKDEAKIKERLARYYKQEEAMLKREISSYYTEYGESGVIDFRALTETADATTRTRIYEEWEAFIADHPEHEYLTPIRESIYKLNRLEALQQDIELQQLRIGEHEAGVFKTHFEKEAEDAFGMWHEIIKEGARSIPAGFWETAWAGYTVYSDSIWNNKIKLAKYLQTDLAAGFARGDSYKRLTDNLLTRFDKVSRRDAYRLVYTTGTHVYAEAGAVACEPYFNTYHLSTVGDSKVCPVCSALEGISFRFADRQTGVNFPPMHPYCRCSFEVDFDRQAFIEEYTKKHSQQEAEQTAKQFEVADE